MNVIVTGGAGFVGSHVVEHLITQNHFPIVVDNFSTGDDHNVEKFIKNKSANLVNVDIRNFDQFKKIPKADAVIHLAAVASISESFKNPKFVTDVNVNGTLNLLEFCRVKKIKKFIFISSASIFGDLTQKVSEKTSPEPTNLYGTTKLIGEEYCKTFSNLFGINCIIFRPFNIFGLRQNKEYAPVIPKFLDKINAKKQPIVFGHGKQTRDFIHVADAARAISMGLDYKNKKFQIFHLGSGKSIKILDLAKIMISVSKTPYLKPVFKKGSVGVLNSSTSINLIKKELGFIPEKNLKAELQKMLS